MKDEDYNIPEEADYVNTVSAMDCTGLIPSGMVKEDELNAYKELYSFGQPVMTEEENRRMREAARAGKSENAMGRDPLMGQKE